MVFSKIFGVIVLVTLALAHPPVKHSGYSILTHHDPPKHHKEEHHNLEHHNLGHGLQHHSGKNSGHLAKHNAGHNPGHNAGHNAAHSAGLNSHHESSGAHGYSGLSDGYASHYPKYQYEYGVKDFHTGDNKDAWEKRDGDLVKGGYSLYDADGVKRIVEYTSDHKSGFNVNVQRLGHASHPQVYGQGHDLYEKH